MIGFSCKLEKITIFSINIELETGWIVITNIYNVKLFSQIYNQVYNNFKFELRNVQNSCINRIVILYI